MADFSSLKQTIQSYIKQNGNEEITGNILQDVLLAMVSTMGDSAINSLASALQDEITARQNQEETLQGNITAEATARQQADTALGGRIDGLQTAINGINTKLAEGYIYAGIATPSTNPGIPSGKVFYIAVSSGSYTNFSNLTVVQGINILKYNGSAWSKDVVYTIDARPKKNSQNLVTSGGIFDNMGALDVSELNATENPHTPAIYADLSAALAAISTDYQKGGMSIKFVQTDDNKYVQYRLMANAFSTTVTDWQGVADEPAAGSMNIISGDGIYNAFKDVSKGFNSVAVFQGTGAASDYSWLEDVNIPAGCAVKNIGSIPVSLYEVKDLTEQPYVTLRPGLAKIVDVDIVAIRNYGSAGNFCILAYKDAYLGVINGDVDGLNYKGETGTGYGWLRTIDIPSGSYVRNNGNGGISLWATKDESSDVYYLKGNSEGIVPFDVTWIRGYSSTNLEYNLFVYKDAVGQNKANEISLEVDNKIESNSKNIFNINSDGILVNKGILYSTGQITNNQYCSISDYIPVKANTAYHLSKTGDNLVVPSGWAIEFCDIYKNRISIIDSSKDFTTPNNCTYLRFTWQKSFTDIMLNKGSERGTYVPYNQLYGHVSDLAYISPQVSGVARYTGETGTGYGYIMEVDIPAGSVLTNHGEGGVTLYDVKDGQDIVLLGGGCLVAPFAIRWIRGRSSQNKTFDISVNVHKDILETKNAVHFVKGSSYTKELAELTDGLTINLDNKYPDSARKGDNIIFNAKITSFSALKIGKGFGETGHSDRLYNSWFEIDTTTVSLYYYYGGGTTLTHIDVPHGLTISEMLNVNIIYNGSITIQIQTLSGMFKYKFENQGNNEADVFSKFYNVSGAVKVMSVGSTFTNARLSATNSDFKCPIWCFGTSYTAVYIRQMIGALIRLGYSNFYLHGFPGSKSAPIDYNFKKALNFGKPQYLLLDTMANDSMPDEDTAWVEHITEITDICKQNAIEVIFVNVPDMKERHFEHRRQWVIDHGYRYIDLVSAVQNAPYEYGTDCWYPGFMRTDGVHPTEVGAYAMAMQILTDFPEIMQYGETKVTGVSGNFAGFNVIGDLTDSGSKPTDFEPA